MHKAINKSRRRASDDQYVDVKNKFRGAFSSSKNPMSGQTLSAKQLAKKIGVIRELSRSPDFDEVMTWLAKYPIQGRGIFPKAKVNQYSDFNFRNVEGELGLEDEIRWVCLVIRNSEALFDEHVHARKTLEEYVYWKSEAEILAYFQTIEQNLGKSIWLMQLKISVLQIFSGTSKQKAYVESIKKSQGAFLAPYVAWRTSALNEESTKPNIFIERFKKQILESDAPEQLKNYLVFLISGRLDTCRDSLASVLKCCNSGSMYDVYECLISVLQHIATSRILVDRKFLLERCLPMLSNIDDIRLKKINFFFSGDSAHLDGVVVVNETPYEERFLSGQNVKMHSAGDADIYPVICDAFTQAAFGVERVHSKENSFLEKLSDSLSQSVAMAENGPESKRVLRKLGVVLGGLPTGKIIASYSDRTAFGYFETNESVFFESDTIKPFDWILCKGEFSESLQRFCLDNNLFPSSLAWLVDDTHTIAGHTQDRALLHMASDMSQGKYVSCIEAIGLLNSNKQSCFVEKHCDRYLVMANLFLEHYDAAILRIAEVSSKYAPMPDYLPVNLAIAGRDWDFYRSLVSNIAIPVALSIYVSRNSDKEQSDFLRDVWDEFVESQGCEKPSELSQLNYDHDLFVHFLREVCVESVMDASIHFDSSSDISKERMEIYYILSDIDPANAIKYEEKIREITKKLEIDKGIREIDSSRIYVSKEPLKVLARRELSDLFSRYKKLVDIQGDRDTDFKEALIEFAQKNKPLPDRYLVIPKSEENNLLLEMVESIKFEFLNNAHHGLDSFLSMRIRHGTLEGTLTSPFDKYGISAEVPRVGEKNESMHWIQSIDGLSEPQIKLIYEGVSLFLETHRQTIRSLAFERLQIRSEERPFGVFDIEVNVPAFRMIADYASEHDSFGEFYDDCIEIVWLLLNPSLKKAKELFHFEANSHVESGIDSLKKLFTDTLNDEQLQQSDILGRLSNLSVDLQSVIESVGNWFNIQEISSFDEIYSMESIVDIAILQAKNVSRGFDPQITRQVNCETMLHSKSMHAITDVLFVMLDNVHKHSNVDSPNTHICVESADDESYLLIQVVSDCEITVDPEVFASTLEDIRENLRIGEAEHRIKSEGRSGMFKLNKFASTKIDNSLEFGLLKSGEFYVTLKVDFFLVESDKTERQYQQKLEI